MDTVEITDNRINVERVTSLVTAPSCGAVSIFIGTTRDNFNGKRVKQLEYECYDSMAKKEMQKICDLIRAKWSVVNIAMVHRLGLGEAKICEQIHVKRSVVNIAIKFCDLIRAKRSGVNIAIHHDAQAMLGVVPVTEASVVIAIASPHRKESLEAVEYAIDTLKANVPIWKKEIYEDDTSEWKSNKECCGRHKGSNS